MPRTTILPPELARARLCYLETTGRVTGQPHEIEIWFAVDAADTDTVYLLSGGHDRADWVKNIRHQRRVRLRIGRETFGGNATIVEGAPQDPLARAALLEKYQPGHGDDLSDWARRSLPVIIRIDGYLGTL
jgi:deazaflavin-dependent oxidoreductase (nitroreductase family)